MMQMEDCHLAIIIVVVDSGGSHQCLLKLVEGRFCEEQNIGVVLEYIPTKYLLITKGKIMILQWKISVYTNLGDQG